MEDKKRILKMVEEGKITSEEAIKLLEALETSNSEKVDVSTEEFLNITPNPDGEKMLYVRVLSSDGSKVKVNIPLEFIKIMGGIGKMHIGELEKHNIDFDKLMDAIDKGFVGRIVEVEDGNDRVIVEIC
ncbi:SHOCT-like domain-containing protein [Paraclostridium bifermentans]|uniref:SHOCT-like domain-containing protein n=1 Tax=Paraclostridium bifermentans TaxID=1490 RepID=UPI0034DDEC0D